MELSLWRKHWVGELDGADVEDLVQEHNEELTIDELLNFTRSSSKKWQKSLRQGRRIGEDALSSGEIKEVLMMWG